MKRILAAFAASLVCASSALCAPARPQQPATPSTPGSRAPARARAARPPPVYRVELVIFRATSALGAPEDWAAEAGTATATSTDADPGGADPSSAQSSSTESSAAPASPAPASAAPASAAPASGASPNGVVGILPSSRFELDGVASRLRASGRYVPVAHIAWAQTASPWGKPMEIPVQSVGLDAQGITGTVALERGVFLHLALDLRYAMSDPPDGLDAPPGTVFVLDESHRVRLKERNYFDHPAFGVIALVTSDRSASRPSR
ncbi:MAG: CsiV family protein [Steroidobacteraceae bacterium]